MQTDTSGVFLPKDRCKEFFVQCSLYENSGFFGGTSWTGSADGTICLKVACLIGLCKACRKELWMLN